MKLQSTHTVAFAPLAIVSLALIIAFGGCTAVRPGIDGKRRFERVPEESVISRSATKPAVKSKKKKDAPLRVEGARSVVVAESQQRLGIPYRYGGNGNGGYDCSGLVSTVYQKVGVQLPRSAREMYDVGNEVDKDELIPGDLVFFANTAGKGITHVGIYVGELRFIHSSTHKGVITSQLDETYYHTHYAGARSLLNAGGIATSP